MTLDTRNHRQVRSEDESVPVPRDPENRSTPPRRLPTILIDNETMSAFLGPMLSLPCSITNQDTPEPVCRRPPPQDSQVPEDPPVQSPSQVSQAPEDLPVRLCPHVSQLSDVSPVRVPPQDSLIPEDPPAQPPPQVSQVPDVPPVRSRPRVLQASEDPPVRFPFQDSQVAEVPPVRPPPQVLQDPHDSQVPQVPRISPVPKQRTKLPASSSQVPGPSQTPSAPVKPKRRTKLPGTSPYQTARNSGDSEVSKKIATSELVDGQTVANDSPLKKLSANDFDFQDAVDDFPVTNLALSPSGVVSSSEIFCEDVNPESPVQDEQILECQTASEEDEETRETSEPEPAGCQGLIMWQTDSKYPPEVCWATIESSKLIIRRQSDRRHVVSLDGLKGLVSIGEPLEETAEQSEKFCFEMVSAGWPASGKTLITTSMVERTTWLQWILRASTCPFGSDLTASFTRAGSVYIKENVGGKLSRAWILLCMEQKLLYRQYLDLDTRPCSEVQLGDLRKVRKISLIYNSDLDTEFSGKATGTCVVLSWTGFALYIESIMKSDTEKWFLFFQKTVEQAGQNLEDKQLTDENIPVVMDKCIQFVELHGLRSLGIYRSSGVQSHVTTLMNDLEKNVSFHIRRDQYNEHDCATVLKRFFRDLPHRLLSNPIAWIETCDLARDVQVTKIKRLIANMPEIHRQVLKRLLCHLYLLQEYHEVNGASVGNLASVWGPSLLLSGGDSDHQLLNSSIAVVNVLITNFTKIFDIDWSVEKEKVDVQHAIQKSKGHFNWSPSSDFILWVKNQVTDKELHFVITPQMQAADMAETLVLETVRSEGVKFLLLEVVSGSCLQRPILRSELLIEILLKWSTWKPTECQDNHLCFKTDQFLTNGLNQIKMLGRRRCYSVQLSFSSNPKFKNGTIEFVDNYMVIKAEQGFLSLPPRHSRRMEISKLNFYFGYDPIRRPPNNLNLTFIHKNEDLPEKRTAFGQTVNFPTKDDYWQFVSFVFGILAPHGDREIFY